MASAEQKMEKKMHEVTKKVKGGRRGCHQIMGEVPAFPNPQVSSLACQGHRSYIHWTSYYIPGFKPSITFQTRVSYFINAYY